MQDFDMDSYLNKRYGSGGTNKIDALAAASESKRAGLAQYAAEATAIKKQNSGSLISQFGLDLESPAGAAINLGMRAYDGFSRNIVAPVVAAPKTIESWYQGATLDEADQQAYNRQLKGEATAQDTALLNQREIAPGEFVSPQEHAAFVAAGARDRGNTKLEHFTKQLEARKVARNITESFDRGALVHQGNRKATNAAFADGSAPALKQTGEGWDDLKQGNVLSGTSDLVSGMAQLLVHAGGVAVNNKMGVAEYVAENAPQLLLGAFGKAGMALQAGTNVGYAADLYQQGMENHVAKFGVLPSVEQQNTMALQSAKAAAAEQAGDLIGVGAMKARSGIAKLAGVTEAEVTKRSFIDSLKGIGKATAAGVASEALTEGYQTHLEGEITGKPASALDIYTGAAIGGLS